MATSSGFPNSVNEGVPWSADLEPCGPSSEAGYRTRLSQDAPTELERDPGSIEYQDGPRDLYEGLPDIAVPKHKVS